MIPCIEDKCKIKISDGGGAIASPGPKYFDNGDGGSNVGEGAFEKMFAEEAFSRNLMV